MATREPSDRIKQLSFKLNALLDITLALSQNLPVRELMEHYRKILQDDLGIGKILLLQNTGDWDIILNQGYDIENLNANELAEELKVYNDISFIATRQILTINSIDIVFPVHQNNDPLAFALVGDIDEDTKGISPLIKHLNFTQILTRVVVMAIDNQRLFRESINQEAMRKELELATRMQTMLIPTDNSLPKSAFFSFHAFYLPHLSVGGDYYDVLTFSETEVGFCIADVSGKGIPAALLMANFQANFRALFTADIKLSKLVKILNDRVLSSANGEKFITFFVGRYNVETRNLNYVNAGHELPLLLNTETKNIIELKIGGPGIGMLDELIIEKEGNIEIPAKAILICYTDGLVEQNFNTDVVSKDENLAELVLQANSATHLVSSVIQSFELNTENPNLFDDVSLLAIDFL